jgi:O-antigen/teichoic acid export membrane protein
VARGGVAASGLVRGGSLNLVGAVCQQGALFLTTAMVARVLGTQDLGRYALGFAMLAMLGLLSLCGFRAALTRYVAVYLADEDPAGVRGTVRLCTTISVAAAVVLAGVLLLTAPQVASVFHDSGLVTGIRLVALTLPAVTLRDAALAATQGWRTQRAFTLIGWIYEPLARLGLTAIALATGMGLTGAFLAILIASWTSALAACWSLWRRMRRTPSARPRFDTREIFGFSMVSWATTLTSTGLIWADTLLLGHLSTTESVGIYNVATRLVTLAVFVMAPLNAAVAPHFAHLFHVGDLRELGRVYTFVTTWILRLSLPAFVALLVFTQGLLGVFGEAYEEGAAVTVVLAAGQLVNAATGPCGTLLNMCGRVRLNMVNNAVTLVLNIGLNLFLIPRMGMLGAAVAWSVSLALVNVARVIQVHHVVGVVPIERATAKALLAALIATATATVSRLTLGGEEPTAWFMGCLVVGLTYVAATILLGLETSETEALGGLFRPKVEASAGAKHRAPAL